MASPSLLLTIRETLREVADPARAPGMQAYMKSEMPYLGVSAVPLRRVCRDLFNGLAWDDAEAWQADVLAIWRRAEFREERHAAIELTGLRVARPFHDLSTLPMYEEMIVTGAWWDLVDTLAGHNLGDLLRAEPRRMKPLMRRWARDPDLWKRRAAILCQLGLKADTDLELLYDCIEPNLASREFFIRKAIGWALRQYAWTDPQEVRRYVREHRERLSPLSVREALKNADRTFVPRTAGGAVTR